MSTEKGKKRTKAFYRKSAYGGKRQCTGSNRLEPGQRGFLVMCNNNESSAIREAYNILNDFADQLFGQGKSCLAAGNDGENNQAALCSSTVDEEDSSQSEEEDIEKALKKEVDSMKSKPGEERRFQNCATKAKNCVFIRSTVTDPVRLAVSIMEDIADKRVSRARFAAKILPIIGTCKAHTTDIEQLAKKVLLPVFSRENSDSPRSFTVLFKTRNNNTTTCGKTSVIPAVTQVVKDINPSVTFSWSDYEVAVLVEIVCTVCCLGLAPSFTRLRKYNLQELVQGPKSTQSCGKDGDLDHKENKTVEDIISHDGEENVDAQGKEKKDTSVCEIDFKKSASNSYMSGEEMSGVNSSLQEITKDEIICEKSNNHSILTKEDISEINSCGNTSDIKDVKENELTEDQLVCTKDSGDNCVDNNVTKTDNKVMAKGEPDDSHSQN